MSENAEIMQQARARLKGNWLTPIFAGIAFVAASIIFGIAIGFPLNIIFGKDLGGLIKTILEFLFIQPAYIGFTLLFYKLITSDDAYIGDVFQPVIYLFKKDKRKIYWRNIRGMLIFAVIGIILLGICSIPFLLLGGLSTMSATPEQIAEMDSTPFLIGCGASMIIFCIVLIFFLPAYMTFNYKLATDETTDAIPCLKSAYNVIIGNRKKYWYLLARFTGWMLLGSVTFGIALLWVIPYLYTAETIFCKELFDKQDSEPPADPA